MQPGSVVRTPYVRHYFPPPPKGQPGPIWEDWKAKDGLTFALLLIGTEPKDGSAQIDPDEFLKSAGWTFPAPPAPPDPELVADGTQELLDAVSELAEAMRQKILANRHKRPLGDCSYSSLFRRIEEEAIELERAVERDHPEASLLEAADVSNFALFTWVKHRREMQARTQAQEVSASV